MESVHVLPKPVSLTVSTGSFQVKSSTHIIVSPESRAVGEYLGSLLNHSANVVEGSEKCAGSFLLTISEADPALGMEGYMLEVSPDSVVVRAPQAVGLFYAVQTLRQLWNVSDPVEIPAVTIQDKPRFPWRGIMLDVGRHSFPVEFIQQLIDVMALHKLNVLHWHLTEDQGWRIEIKRYPRLTEVGSRREASPIMTDRHSLDGVPYQGYYTQEQVRQVVAYAASRFITVVPEIEMPGHAKAALASYPELGCTGGPYQVRPFWGVEEDVYCAGNEQEFSFLQDVLDEVLELFPSEFIHIGGDECPKMRWEKCPKCQDVIQHNRLQDEHALQSYFIRRMESYLNAKGRRIIGWDEILEGGLAPNASVMAWRGIEGGIQAVREGHDVVMTPTSHCYLDYYQSEDTDSECPAIGGYLPLEHVYRFDPVPSDFSDREAAHVLGGQGNLWTEYIATPEQAGTMLFPRATALAEVLWSNRDGRDYQDFLRRLEHFLPLMTQMGMSFHKL